MPKSPSTASPSSPINHSKPASDSVGVRMSSDVALRKKKNADAQAAFRARRANYIATLEETVTSLESVVLQLQDSCRETRNENMDLRQENARLRHENREREKWWRALFQARKNGHPQDPEELPPGGPLASPFLGHAPVSSGLASHASTPLLPQQQSYANGIGYRGDDPAGFNTGGANSGSFGNQQSPAPFSNHEPGDGSSGRKYAGYPYSIQSSPRDARWQVSSTVPGGLNGGDAVTPPHSQSPSYIESPSLTSPDMTAYPARYSDEGKVGMPSVLDNAPYVFPSGDRYQNVGESIPNSRSMSPTTSTPNSSTSIPLTSSFQFTFQEASAGQDRAAEFDYRRQSLPHCPEVMLHGGTADISLTGPQASADALRYRIGRRPDSVADHRTILPPSENGSQHDQGSNDGDPSYANSHTRSRRNTLPSHSRSPSPGGAPISCTVAVIKAQAFGALRRTRAKTKRTSEGAARVAMDVLEARGIGVGPTVGNKRPRLDLDDDDLDAAETP